jgi:HTH-type transcriptional regulator / antitoxin HigA
MNMRKTISKSKTLKKPTKATSVEKTAAKKKATYTLQIKTQEAYELTMTEIDNLMKRGEANLSSNELSRLSNLAKAAEQYEFQHEPLPMPSSFQDIVRMKIYKLHMSQTYAAKLLGVSDAKFSLIMSGKQKPDIYFVKAVYEKLKIDGNMILAAI